MKTTYVRFEEDLYVCLSDFVRLLYQIKILRKEMKHLPIESASTTTSSDKNVAKTIQKK